MTDPLRPRDQDAPRRATPLQPDKPGSGDRQESRGEQPEPSARPGGGRDDAERAREQEKTAVDNAREGYK